MAEPYTTTILGVTYNGRPKMGSLAFDLWKAEQGGDCELAERMLRAKNVIRKVWGIGPVNLQDDMTNEPLEGGFSFGRQA